MNKIILDYKNNLKDLETTILLLDKSNFTKEEIKKGGIVYTPKYIVDYMIEELQPTLLESIFEPSVGHGIFIFSLIEYMLKKYNLSNIELKKWFLTKVYACDIENNNIVELKELIIIFFNKMNIIIEEQELKNIFCANTLTYKCKFDIIIGNPPYINSKNLTKDNLKYLKSNWKSCESGNIDIYYAFIEYALNNSIKSSFIVPNSWFVNESAFTLRQLIKKDLNKIIHFKNEKVFPNISLFATIFITDKTNEQSYIHYKTSISNEYIKFEKNLLREKWHFNKDVLINKDIFIFKYHTPIATLRDKIFIIKKDNPLTENVIPFFKLTKIKKIEDLVENEEKIVLPYYLNEDLQKYNLLPEDKLNKDTLNYLKSNKEELLQRDFGKQSKYPSWFCYGRAQGLNVYNQNNYVVIIPQMITIDYNFFIVKLSDLPKEFLFSSGYMLETNKTHIYNLVNFLNSDNFKKFVEKEGKNWEGNEKSYYSLTIKQLKSIFLL